MRLSTRIWQGINGKSLAIGLTTFLAVVAFTITGVTSSMHGLDANVAAQVGEQMISMRTLQGVVQRQARRDNSDEATRNANIRSALDSLIQESVVVEEASRIGWTANDIEVAYWIKNIPSFQDENSKVFDKKKYDNFIKSGQMSELELFQEGRNSIATQKYSALLSLDTHIPLALAKEYAKKNGVSFSIEFLEIKAAEENVTRALEEKTKALLANAAELENLKKTYEAKKADYNRPASPRVSTLLVAYKEAAQAQGEALTRSKEDALKKANELLAKLQAGSEFATLSDASNDDIKAKVSKGDIGFVDENSLDPKSLEAARALSADGQLSAVVDTEFGFRILKRTAHREALNRSFEDVQVELAHKQLRPEVVATMNQEVVSKIEAALAAASTDLKAQLDPIVNENKLTWQSVKESVTAESRFITEIGMAEPILKSLFRLRNKGDIASKVIPVAGKSILVRLVERKDSEADDAKINSTREIKVSELRQSFATEARRKLYDIFSESREIKRNASLVQAN